MAEDRKLEKTVIRDVLVGSRLHGLYCDDRDSIHYSDHDYRGIFVLSAKDKLSPFRKEKTKNWVEGDSDNVMYELCHFCHLATKGNMTVLEVLYSDINKKDFETPPIGEELYHHRDKFIYTKGIVSSSIGYANNQLAKLESSEPTDRTPKFAVSYIRVLSQCIHFLKEGTISTDIGPHKDFCAELKWSFEPKMMSKFTTVSQDLKKEIRSLEPKVKQVEPDKKWIEDFIVQSHLIFR